MVLNHVIPPLHTLGVQGVVNIPLVMGLFTMPAALWTAAITNKGVELFLSPSCLRQLAFGRDLALFSQPDGKKGPAELTGT
jgi:hypothetical protein